MPLRKGPKMVENQCLPLIFSSLCNNQSTLELFVCGSVTSLERGNPVKVVWLLLSFVCGYLTLCIKARIFALFWGFGYYLLWWFEGEWPS